MRNASDRSAFRRRGVLVAVVLAAVLIALVVLARGWWFSRETSPSVPPLPEQAGIPEPVARMRERIYAAAARGDYAALRPLIPPGGFRYSFGNGGDPIEFWKELEKEGERPLEIMAAILRVPYTIVRAGDVVYYVWPFVFDRSIDSLTPEELALVRTFATDEQIAGWKEFGGYIGYRLGIRADGTWLYFVAGD